MASYLLVPGACHGAWCWERVIPLLRSQGHGAQAIDLPGMGGDTTPLADVTLDCWAERVVAALDALPAPRVLVAHSRGGIVISQAAEYASEQVAGLVYVAALLIPDGKSGYDMAALSGATPIPANLAADGASFTLDREVARARLYNRTAPANANAALDRLEAEPMAPLATQLRLSTRRYGRVPRSYVGCSDDRSTIDETLRRKMVAESPCEMVRVIDADHSPFVSAPAALAEAILQAPAAS